MLRAPIGNVLMNSRFRRALPCLAALAYPGLIWCGPAIHPAFLAIAMLVPLLGLVTARGIDHQIYPRSRWIALAVVTTPPLYSFLGGWLDFQHATPIKGLHVWMTLWLVGLGIVLFEKPNQRSAGVSLPGGRPGLAFAHGVSAVLIACFAAAHLSNHLGGLWGDERHTAILHALRPVYRNPIIETLLLASIAFQISSGVVLLRRKLPAASSWIDMLQAASGAYLLMFFLSHLSATLKARHLRNIDTNWQWLTGDNLLTAAWSSRLTPYYFLAVIALGIHLGAGARHILLAHCQSAQTATRGFYAVVAGAAVLSAAIITGLIRGSI
jgi:hypothetical protein